MINFIYPGKLLLTTGTLACLLSVKNSFHQHDHKNAGMEFYRNNADTSKQRWENYISLNEYSHPFWKADTIVDESVQVVKKGTHATAGLLFKAREIISVKAANYNKVFIKGQDWDYKNGRLIFGPESAVPYFTENQLFYTKEMPGHSISGKTPGTFISFSEGDFFSSMQIVVTYVKEKGSKWKGPTPVFAASTLPNTILKLKNKENLKVVFYGNSIEAGYNASGFENVAPFMPAWPELVIYNLREHYGGNVTYSNQSVAGRTAKWGRDSVSGRVLPENPGLVIIGFGMNDGSAKLPPQIYREQISAIIDSVHKQNPETEFILISPMLPNPLSSFNGTQALFKKELDKLKRTGVVVTDMTGVHAELLKHKTYQDMTGNNVNHPNDYLARWYAQMICGALIK